jgi:hypothetical protein
VIAGHGRAVIRRHSERLQLDPHGPCPATDVTAPGRGKRPRDDRCDSTSPDSGEFP